MKTGHNQTELSTHEQAAASVPVSHTKLPANRANAQERTGRSVPVVRDQHGSTGPRTEEGKAVSSRNNTRHGLAGDFCLLPGEDAAQFQILLEALTAEHNPKTTSQRLGFESQKSNPPLGHNLGSNRNRRSSFISEPSDHQRSPLHPTTL